MTVPRLLMASRSHGLCGRVLFGYRKHVRLLSVGPRPAATPDFNTTVDVASISLPESPAQLARKQRRKLKKQLEDGLSGSLIESTLHEMETDEEFQLTAKRLKELGQERMTREEKKMRRRALDELGVPSFDRFLQENDVEQLARTETEIFQINIGLYCNQACAHCHVESSPRRTEEQLSRELAEQCIRIIGNSPSIKTVDITGGAPELNSEFRYVVQEARKMGKEVIDRCNLTVLLEPGQEDLAEFLAEHQVHVVASLPCYGPSNVDLQRGNGVFDRSIAGLLRLNELGYGVEGSGLVLDLVYNPLGGFLPPAQDALQEKYKEELEREFGIVFNSLFTITNMPIKRFADFLHRRGELKQYMELLVRNFNPSTCEGIMCSNTVSVSWDGRVYDCDFNQQLAMPLKKTCSSGKRKAISLYDLESTADLMEARILTGSHCFGCTAGEGSS